MNTSPLLRMQGITVRFGDVVANDAVDLTVERGEVRALLGENGAGKTTLMKALVGLVQPQAGTIYLQGKSVQMRSPVDAMARGIGMVHQHFMLIPPLTVAQNVCIGLRSAGFPFPNLRRVAEDIRRLAGQYGLQIDPDKRVSQLSVGAQQRVEILKTLYRGAQLLILDEPTSVLTPQETENLFAVVRNLVRQGNAVIFISHKLNEVMAISRHVTVLRKGQVVATRETGKTVAEELAELMVGRSVELPHLEQPAAEAKPPLVTISGLRYQDERKLPILQRIDLDIRPGEIHGLAGVDGNGQEELAGILAGILPATAGTITLDGREITRDSPAQRIDGGLAHIPGDRQRLALVMDLPLEDNCILEVNAKAPYARRGFLQFDRIRELARNLIAMYDIRCLNEQQLVATLSGGNQQKLVLARALFRGPRFLIATQPTRGLDVGAIAFVYSALLAQRERGCAILLISTELDEILALSDRISVIYEGRIMGTMPRAAAQRGARADDGGKTAMSAQTQHSVTPLSPSRWRTVWRSPWVTHLAAIVLALATGAVLMLLMGVSPLEAYGALLDGAVGNQNSLAETLARAIPLALAGIGVSIAFQAGVFNVGAEGQLYLGATAATWVGLLLAGLPALPLLALMLVAGAAVGGAWAAVAAILKVRFQASELINTIMMNYIAIFFVAYLVHGPLQEPGSPLGQTARLASGAILPVILPRTRLHFGLILAVAAAIVLYIVLWRTPWGFQIRVVGRNALAARNAGIQVSWCVISAFVVSGALAGIAGFAEASGMQHRMIENLSPGYGYTAIVVALLGQLNPPIVLASAILFAALQVGASTMESAVGVPSSVVTIVQYLIVIFIIGRGAFDWIAGRWPRRQPG